MAERASGSTGAVLSDRFSPAVGAAMIGGVGVAAAIAAYAARSRSHRPGEDDRRRALIVYLQEHLAGSDVAVDVVLRLRRSHRGSPQGGLFAYLASEFEKDRAVVRSLLTGLGGSSRSVKRVAAHASGALLGVLAGGRSGELSLVRTLEGLAIGVQGKRCMWRALASVGGTWPVPGGRTFAGLEASAVRQWEAIEAHRRDVAATAFPALDAAIMGERARSSVG